MTILIGLKCTDGLVMAADSQTSYGYSSKRCETDKIAVLDVATGVQALVAQSGDATMSNRAIEIMRNLVPEHPLNDYRGIAGMCEAALRQLKAELCGQYGCSVVQLEEILNRDGSTCAFLIGHYFQGSPLLFVLNLFPGIANLKSEYAYATAGCAAVLGDYLMGEHSSPTMNVNQGTVLAIYAVDAVKRYDSACGGATRVKWVFPNGTDHPIKKLGQSDVDRFGEYMAEHESRFRAHHNKELAEFLNCFLLLKPINEIDE
jgi:20S proteasome alpha/beta subunit